MAVVGSDVFPAHAGVIPGQWSDFKSAAGIPRACGGDPELMKELGACYKVFPAHAGVIPGNGPDLWRDIRIPRACGGDPGSNPVKDNSMRYSPRMRG